MAARYCAECGAAFVDDARFCIGCGQRRPGARSTSRFSPARYPAIFVVGSVLVVGTIAVGLGHLSQAPPPSVPSRNAGPASGGAGGAPGGGQSGAGTMPADHPPVELPADVRKTIDDMQKTAESKPQDADAWRHLGNVLYRASQIERSYLQGAEKAFRHLLEIVPEDPEALQMLGNISFDLDQFDGAVDFYQRYLKLKPDDLGVLTDLGTMYLSKGDLSRAIKTYDQVLKVDPKFFQAQFNLAIAYRSAGQLDASIGALQRAKEIAPDDETKAQVEKLIARAQGTGAPQAGGQPAAAAAPAEGEAAGTFREAVETVFRQHQMMASKVQRFEWQSDTSAKLYLADFPMAQMPENMRSMFLDRFKERIRQQKEKFRITEPVQIELIDLASGTVMDTLTE